MARLVFPQSSVRLASLCLVLLLLSSLGGCTALPPPADQITQISTYSALEKGLYDGDATYAELEQLGNFGIGTFDGMDGEMVGVDGQFYQARADGSVLLANKDQESPFATVVYFTPERRLQLTEPVASYDQLKAYLTKVLSPGNQPLAIRIDGTFRYLKIRSIPRQTEPYPPLTDVIAHQVTWERANIRGTLVGYWFPQYLSTLNAPGYHLHFISEDKQIAGHMLECDIESATISVDSLEQVNLRLPGTRSFAAADLSTKP